MTTVSTKSGRIIKVVSREEEKSTLTESDSEMDERAVEALAGPNGSGKSTITTFFDKVGKSTNADDVVATTGMNNMEAAVLVDRMRYESIAKKEDFTFETVLSSEYKLIS